MTEARRSDKLKSGLLISLAMMALIAWLSPYWSIAGLIRSATLGNSYEFSEHIDVVSLRESIKGQATAQLTRNISSKSASGFEAFGSALGIMMVDKIVDQFVTPAALSSAIKKSIGKSGAEQLPTRIALTVRLLQRGDVRWSSANIVYVGSQDLGRFVFRRSFLSWTLVAIELPPDAFES
ncbi:DUF2939 domain-containing protein [Steroidobacter cummioxidans]|uniref:DUF2939 domain-containing protein n=1 Tax=Steroidobacter cummioxidans TaxID=1803913 RepID=UPI000E312814|nr:DUF2939 domain-containing protein [Steroidobacter cummioxidans]